MAQFRSSASEGNFNANQINVPDRVNKIQAEGNRRLQGMSNAQSRLERNQAIFLQAQQQTQALQSKGKQASFQVQQQATKAQADSQALAYDRQLKKKNAQDKYKIDTFGAIANFSQTAFKITQGIIKQNQETQQKAINQVSSRLNLSHQDVINAKSINSSITNAQFQETELAKKYIKEGKSQEFLNTYHEHLVKGGGYKNYISNAVVIAETGRKNAIQLKDYGNELLLKGVDTDEIRKLVAAKEAELRGALTIDGVVPSAQIEESSGYNAQLRKVSQNLEDSISAKKNKDLEESITIQQSNAIVHEFNNNGVGGALKLLETNSVADGPRTVVSVLLAQNPTEEELNQILDTPLNVNGQETTIRTSYPEVTKLVNIKLNNKKAEAREELMLEKELLQQQGLAAAYKVAEEATSEDGYLDPAEARNAKQAYREIAGFGTDESILIGIDRQAGDPQTAVLMQEQFEERRLNKTLTVDMLEMSGAPKQVYDQYIGEAQRQDKLRRDPQYKTINSYLGKRVTDSIKDSEAIKYSKGDTQSDQFNWFVGEEVKKYRKEVLNLVESGTPLNQALTLIGDKAAKESLTTIETPGAVDDYQIKAYQQYMSNVDKNLLEASKRVTKWKKLTPTQKEDENNWVASIGKQPLIAASKRLAETGESMVLEQIGQQVGLTKYQVQHKLSEVIDIIEPIEIVQTQSEIQENWSSKQKYSFLAAGVAAEQRSRELQQQINGMQQRNSFQPRESFQQQASTNNDPPSEGAYSKQQVIDLAISVGFSPEDAYTASQIAKGESGRDPTNSTERSGLKARTGEDSVGMMQINWGYHKDRGWLQKLGITKREDLFDPVLNMKAAKYLKDNAGNFTDWTVYTSGEYANY